MSEEYHQIQDLEEQHLDNVNLPLSKEKGEKVSEENINIFYLLALKEELILEAFRLSKKGAKFNSHILLNEARKGNWTFVLFVVQHLKAMQEIKNGIKKPKNYDYANYPQFRELLCHAVLWRPQNGSNSNFNFLYVYSPPYLNRARKLWIKFLISAWIVSRNVLHNSQISA